MSVHSKYTSALNYRTLISIIISLVATWLSYKYNFRFNLDLTLISVAVVFPLVFTLGSAFQRRDKSLEHLSRTKAALATIYYSFTQARDMPEKTKDEIYEGIKKIKVSLITFLSSQSNDRTDLNKNIGVAPAPTKAKTVSSVEIGAAKISLIVPLNFGKNIPNEVLLIDWVSNVNINKPGTIYEP